MLPSVFSAVRHKGVMSNYMSSRIARHSILPSVLSTVRHKGVMPNHPHAETHRSAFYSQQQHPSTYPLHCSTYGESCQTKITSSHNARHSILNNNFILFLHPYRTKWSSPSAGHIEPIGILTNPYSVFPSFACLWPLLFFPLCLALKRILITIWFPHPRDTGHGSIEIHELESRAKFISQGVAFKERGHHLVNGSKTWGDSEVRRAVLISFDWFGKGVR